MSKSAARGEAGAGAGPRLAECIGLPLAGLGAITKLFLLLDAEGLIQAVGPTLQRLFAGRDLRGASVFVHFDLRAPDPLLSLSDLRGLEGRKLQILLHKRPDPRFRGTIMALAAPEGWLFVNLSFGVDIAEVVRRHQLTAADFAPTDLAMELLYLTEANAVVVSELRAFGQRREEARRQAEEESLTDALTGLRNRRAFNSIIARLCREGRPFALMQLDLDYFKQVNDTLGHAAGDHVLKSVTAILRNCMSERDFIARLGGDEFVMLLPGTAGPSRLEAIGQHLIAAIRAPIRFEDKTCHISASIGVASVGSGDRTTPSAILAEADEALYKAKEAGRGCIRIRA